MVNRAHVNWVFPSLLAWVAGSALQLQQPTLFDTTVYASILLIVLVVWSLLAIVKIVDWVRLVLWVVAAGAVAFAATGLRSSTYLADGLADALEGQDLVVIGVVAAMPQRNETGLRFRLDVESARRGDGAGVGVAGQRRTQTPVAVPPHIYLGWYDAGGGVMAGAMNSSMNDVATAKATAGGVTEGDVDSSADAATVLRQPQAVQAGERWQLTVRLKAPHGGSNPHGFDYELWLWEQGLQATGYVRTGPRDLAPQRLGQTGSHPIERARQRVRDAIFERVPNRQAAGVIAALVVGDQNAIERADWDIFRATGVAHLMSISGLHVTMFAWVAALGVGGLWRRSARACLACPAPHAALIGGVLLALAYALFSGGGVPAQRTILMLAAVGVLRLAGKQWPWPQVWMLACAVVVAVDPWALTQAGFWLSFVAVGILFATDNRANYEANKGIWAKFLSLFHEQWVITLALTPLTLLLFGQVSVVGLLANAFAIPWVTLVLTPLAMLGVLAAPAWSLAAWAVQALAWVLKILSEIPFASIFIARAPLWAGTFGLLGGILLVMRLPWGMRLLGLPLVLPVLFWQPARPQTGQFELLAADIGQGNAVIVQTARHVLVYDAGPRFSRESDAGHRVLVPLLRALDLQVDTLMLSHRDSDHTGGALAVLTMQPQAKLVSAIEDEHALQTLRLATRCVAGQHWRWDGVDFELLHPLETDYGAGLKPNALSCVLRISNGTQAALLVGDIEQAQEARLVASRGGGLQADLLLVPHHGSKTSSSEAFLDAVKPKIALVQAGYRNRFGHPAASVIDRYEARSIAVFDSAHCGAASWASAAPADVKCERESALRYWHHRVP